MPIYDKSIVEQLGPVYTKIDTSFFVSHLSCHINMKSYGPYMRNGKQFWRNYHRPIKRKDAKTLMEVIYMKYQTEWKLLCQSM